MSTTTFTETAKAVQDQTLQLLRSSQDVTVKAAQAWIDGAQQLTKAAPGFPVELPQATEVVDTAFGWVESLLAAQKELTLALLESAAAAAPQPQDG